MPGRTWPKELKTLLKNFGNLMGQPVRVKPPAGCLI